MDFAIGFFALPILVGLGIWFGLSCLFFKLFTRPHHSRQQRIAILTMAVLIAAILGAGIGFCILVAMCSGMSFK